MWNSAHDQELHIEVDYYDAEQKHLLLGYPTAQKIDEIVTTGLNVPVPEFLTYFLYHRVRVAPAKYNSYASVRTSIADAAGMLDLYLKLNDGMLNLADGAESLPSAEIERVGESLGLSVMNAVHEVTEADWLPIPEQRGKGAYKTFDYQLASNSTHIIQLESKGTLVDDAGHKTGSVYKHKVSITDKKKSGLIVPENTLRYGVIAQIPKNGQKPRCLLVDPEPSQPVRSPRELQLFARLRFLAWFIWLVSPRSALAYALATRVRAVEALRDPYELNNVPLGRPDGEPFAIQFSDAGHAKFFATRSRVQGGPAGGIVMPIHRNALMFVGFRSDLLILAAEQNFEQLTTYSAETALLPKRVACMVPAGEFSRFDIADGDLSNVSSSGGYVHFQLSGWLNYSREGLVFGFLPIGKEQGHLDSIVF
jgi:hypothetical protein